MVVVLRLDDGNRNVGLVIKDIVLLKRFATVDEVAAMVTYLASEVSSATNGAALRVDGSVVKAIL